MLWVGLDFETTGLDTSKDRIIEIGAILWEANKKIIINAFSTFVWDWSYPQISEEIEEIVGVNKEDIQEYSILPTEAMKRLLKMCQGADYLVAHNANAYDRLIMESEMKRLGFVSGESLEWIDSRTDLPLPKRIVGRKLVHVAAEHHIVNPFAHRALTDTLTMLQLMSLYNAEEIVKRSKSPSVIVRALVSYENRADASSRGYQWNPNLKEWRKLIKECDLIQETQNVPFKTQVIMEMKNAEDKTSP